MSKYYVYRKDIDRYLAPANNEWVSKYEACVWNDKETAERRKQELVKKEYYDKVQVMEYCWHSSKEIEKRYKKLLDAVETLSYVSDIHKYYSDKKQACEDMTQDILHKIELEPISLGLEGIELLYKLKNVRKERRECKDAIRLCNMINNTSLKKFDVLVEEYNKYINDRTYVPKALPEIFNKKESDSDENN